MGGVGGKKCTDLCLQLNKRHMQQKSFKKLFNLRNMLQMRSNRAVIVSLIKRFLQYPLYTKHLQKKDM